MDSDQHFSFLSTASAAFAAVRRKDIFILLVTALGSSSRGDWGIDLIAVMMDDICVGRDVASTGW